MRAETLIQSQLLIAESVFAMAEHIANSTGYQLTPVTFAMLPAESTMGALACISDSTVSVPGNIVAGGGTNAVLAWFNGTAWKVVA